MPPADQNQRRDHGQMTDCRPAALDPEVRAAPVDRLTGRLRHHLRRPLLHFLDDRTALPNLRFGSRRFADRHVAQADEHREHEPRQPAAIQIRLKGGPANDRQIDQAADKEVARPDQQPEISPPQPARRGRLPGRGPQVFLLENQQSRREQEERDQVPVAQGKDAVEFEEEGNGEDGRQIKPRRRVGQREIEKDRACVEICHSTTSPVIEKWHP